VDGEQVSAEDADVDGVERAQRVPGDDHPLAGEGILIGADRGDAVHPAVAQPDPEPDPHPRVVPDIGDPACAGAVLGDDPERVALAAVADRNPPDLAGCVPSCFQDRQSERVDADAEHKPEQRVEGVPLERPYQQHLGAATADREQEQAEVDAGLHERRQQARTGDDGIRPPDERGGDDCPGDEPARHAEARAESGDGGRAGRLNGVERHGERAFGCSWTWMGWLAG
jgi:hypothetical protein